MSAPGLQVSCPHCDRPLPDELRRDGELSCPFCWKRFRLLLFNPVQRRSERSRELVDMPEGSAVCGNHPRNVAERACSRCGMFICALCAIDTDETVLCPGCYDRLSEEGALASTRLKFRDYTGLSITTAAAGVFFWFLMAFAVTGPLSILYAIRALKQRKVTGDTGSSWRIWLSMLVGLAETAGAVFMIIGFIGLAKK